VTSGYIYKKRLYYWLRILVWLGTATLGSEWLMETRTNVYWKSMLIGPGASPVKLWQETQVLFSCIIDANHINLWQFKEREGVANWLLAELRFLQIMYSFRQQYGSVLGQSTLNAFSFPLNNLGYCKLTISSFFPRSILFFFLINFQLILLCFCLSDTKQ